MKKALSLTLLGVLYFVASHGMPATTDDDEYWDSGDIGKVSFHSGQGDGDCPKRFLNEHQIKFIASNGELTVDVDGGEFENEEFYNNLFSDLAQECPGVSMTIQARNIEEDYPRGSMQIEVLEENKVREKRDVDDGKMKKTFTFPPCWFKIGNVCIG